MTEQEANKELERTVEKEYPLIASRYIDKEIILRVAQKLPYKVEEWCGADFPYQRLHDDFMGLIEYQYLTTSYYDIFYVIGEEKVVTFLNNYFRWWLDERDKLDRELDKNKFELNCDDQKDFEEFQKTTPIPSKEPLDIAGYLHMCRIAYDAAPRSAYPDFISDLYVVAVAKWDSCGLGDRDHHSVKMKVGDPYPEFMYYHSEEMGFGGPYVYFIWEDDGWIMEFGKKECRNERERNMNIHRFLAMRRAGYPVVYSG